MKRVGVFYVNAGGGHASAAKAIATEMEKKYSGQMECVLINAMSGQKNFAHWLFEKGYTYAINYFAWLWWFIYWISQFRFILNFEDYFFRRTVKRNLRDLLVRENFDEVVSLYFFLNRSLVQLIEENNLKAKISCVVTDPFTAPNTWFLEKNISYYVFSKEASLVGERFGVSREKIAVISPIIKDQFHQAAKISTYELRRKFGWPEDKKIVLVMSGGTGLYHGPQALWRLLKIDGATKIVVICGKDKIFLKHARWLAGRYPQKFLAVYGFAENVPEIMRAVDLVISKAGPATVFEALILRKPIILLYYLWKQEQGNRDFVVQNGIGEYVPRLRKLNQVVEELLVSETTKKNIEDAWPIIGRESGTEQLLQKIIKNP